MAEPKGYLVVPCAFDPDGRLRALELDADDHLIVSLGGGAGIEVQQYGYIGGDWQKQPVSLGYSDQIAGRLSDTNAPAGDAILNSSVVPSGEIWVIISAASWNSNHATTSSYVFAVVGSDLIPLIRWGSSVAGLVNCLTTNIILKPGDNLRYVWNGVTAGDDLYATWLGYKIDIDL